MDLESQVKRPLATAILFAVKLEMVWMAVKRTRKIGNCSLPVLSFCGERAGGLKSVAMLSVHKSVAMI